MKTYKADLHVHSSYSNKPTYWAMRKFNVPESYSSPLYLYQNALTQGMDFVTITDHNAINGALEIAHLPNTFISSEITSHFPENGCMVVLHISEMQFGEIMRLRKNVYELTTFLRQQQIVHFLAHPLYAQNDKLTVEIIEKCLLLFTVFEVKNGCRARRFNHFTAQLIGSLTPGLIERLAGKYPTLPVGPTAWLKGIVGGSDDHGGLFIARAHTCSHQGASLEAFLAAITGRQSWADGEDGGPLTMAHSLYGIAHSFYRAEMEATLKGYPALFTGYLQGEALQQAYASARLFVFPSATDTFGNVVLEAQASGLAVIVSDSGGPQELMRADETGLVFSAGNLEQLVAAIHKLLDDPSLLTAMGQRARQFVLEKAPDHSVTYSTILQTGSGASPAA